MLHNFKRGAHGKILAELTKIADAGQLKTVLDEAEFGLEQIGQAHDRLASGKERVKW